jgi:hypothetical protein
MHNPVRCVGVPQIPEGMPIEGLKQKLIKIMSDYTLQVSIFCAVQNR